MDIQKALDKIKKCLALSKSSNEHEAAQALKQAHSLMRLFNLDYDDVEKSQLNNAFSNIKSGITTWHTILISSISQAFSAVPTLNSGFNGDRIEWHGYGVNAELASYTYQVLYRQCANARSQYMKNELKRVTKKANKTIRANVYAEAWCRAIHKVVCEFLSDDEKETLNSINSLVTKGTKTHKPRDRNAYKNASSHVKSAAQNDYYNGSKDGSKVKLHKPVTGNDPMRIE